MFLVADRQLYKTVCPSLNLSIGPSLSTSRKLGKLAFWKLFVYVSLLEGGFDRALGAYGGWLPLPTHLQQYCDPVSLV